MATASLRVRAYRKIRGLESTEEVWRQLSPIQAESSFSVSNKKSEKNFGNTLHNFTSPVNLGDSAGFASLPVIHHHLNLFCGH
jgi:hypothetical protein